MTTTDMTGPLALALDELLTHMAPAQARALAEWAEHDAPPAVRAHWDQNAAASRDALALLDAEAVLLGGTGRISAPHGDVPGWVRLGASAARPEPVYAAAWRPGLVACIACLHLLELPRGSAASRTCDSCGRVTTGVEHGDGIHPCRVQYGPLTLAFGTCGDCLPAIARTATQH